MIEDQVTAKDQATTPKTRRRFSTVEKKNIVRECQLPGCSVPQVAQALRCQPSPIQHAFGIT